MANKKTSAKPAKKAAAKNKTEDVVMWLRLPRPMKVEELKKLGLQGAGCFGGDTCIAATSAQASAGIVVQADLKESLKRAGLSRRADPCFGGDTCIV
jgi:hypothetical protein